MNDNSWVRGDGKTVLNIQLPAELNINNGCNRMPGSRLSAAGSNNQVLATSPATPAPARRVSARAEKDRHPAGAFNCGKCSSRTRGWSASHSPSEIACGQVLFPVGVQRILSAARILAA